MTSAVRSLMPWLCRRISGCDLRGAAYRYLDRCARRECCLHPFDIDVAHFFRIDQRITRPFVDTYQLIKFELYCLRVTSLRVLDHEDHEKSDNRRSGVNDKLPGIRPTEDRAGGRPQKHYRHREHKRGRATDLPFDPAGKPRKYGSGLSLRVGGARSIFEGHLITINLLTLPQTRCGEIGFLFLSARSWCLLDDQLRFLMHRPQGRCVFELLDRFGDAPQFRADNLFRAL